VDAGADGGEILHDAGFVVGVLHGKCRRIAGSQEVVERSEVEQAVAINRQHVRSGALRRELRRARWRRRRRCVRQRNAMAKASVPRW
jgi:hypothetical protein